LISVCRTLCLALFLFLHCSPSTSVVSTLSLHDALPICAGSHRLRHHRGQCALSQLDRREHAMKKPNFLWLLLALAPFAQAAEVRSEEHTSELQSREKLVCRLLLEKKKNLSI